MKEKTRACWKRTLRILLASHVPLPPHPLRGFPCRTPKNSFIPARTPTARDSERARPTLSPNSMRRRQAFRADTPPPQKAGGNCAGFREEKGRRRVNPSASAAPGSSSSLTPPEGCAAERRACPPRLRQPLLGGAVARAERHWSPGNRSDQSSRGRPPAPPPAGAGRLARRDLPTGEAGAGRSGWSRGFRRLPGGRGAAPARPPAPPPPREAPPSVSGAQRSWTRCSDPTRRKGPC